MGLMLVTGDNEYAIKEYVDKRVAKFIDKYGRDAVEKRRGEDIKKSDIPDLLGGVSLFVSERLVVIDRPEDSKEFSEYLADHIGPLPEDVELILIEPKPDKRTRWFKSVKKQGEIIEKLTLHAGAASSWVQRTVKERGGTIDAKSANHLVERIGTNQWQLHNEINKLLSYNQTINRSSINELVEPTLHETIFQLLDAAVQGDENKALELHNELSLRDLDPHQTVAMLGWQVHNMLLVKTNMNTSPAELAGKGGMAPFVVQKTKKLVRNVRLGQIKQLIDLILAAETDIKQTGADAHRRTQHLISQVAQLTS